MPVTSVLTASPRGQGLERYLNLVIVYLTWGASYFAVKLIVSGAEPVSPLLLQTARAWGAALILALIMLVLRVSPGVIKLRDLLMGFFTGVLMWVAGNGLATLSSRYASSSFIVMAMGVIPIWVTVIVCARDRRWPTSKTLLGLVLGSAGLGAIFTPPLLGHDASAIAAGYAPMVVTLLTLAGFTWALATVLQGPLLRRVSAGWLACYQSLGAAIALTVITACSSPSLPQMAAVSGTQIAAFLFLTIMASAVCLLAYLKVIRAFSPAVASTFAYVNPVVGVLLGWELLGERPSVTAIVGIAMILLGVAAVLVGPKRTSLDL